MQLLFILLSTMCMCWVYDMLTMYCKVYLLNDWRKYLSFFNQQKYYLIYFSMNLEPLVFVLSMFVS